MRSIRFFAAAGLAGVLFGSLGSEPPLPPRPDPEPAREIIAAPGGKSEIKKGGIKIRGKITGLKNNDHALIHAEGPRFFRTTTRVDGIWELQELVPGTYVITPHHDRYLFDPPSRRLEIGKDLVSKIDFTARLKVPPTEDRKSISKRP